MKRLVRTLLTFTALIATGAFSSATAFADTPDNISYQGQLTDGGGAPLSGVYSLTFNIYEVDAGGISLWTEVQAAVNVSGGLFSVSLGAVTPLDDAVFNSPERYLGVTVGGDPEIAPRVKFTSVAYANRISTVDGATGGAISSEVDITANTNANTVSAIQSGLGRAAYFQVSNPASPSAAVQGTHVGAGAGGSFFSDGGGPGIVANATGGLAAELNGRVEAYGDVIAFDGVDTAMHVDVDQYTLSTFGGDGLEQVRIWGISYGEIQLYDNTDNDMVAALSASSNTGGNLTLMDEDGATQVKLRGGITGDDAAIMPVDGINSGEILNEVGVTNRIQTSTIQLDGADSSIALRTITVPADGYVFAIGTVKMQVTHTLSIQDEARIGIEPTAGGAGITTTIRVGSGSASANWETPVTVQGMFSVSAGANQFDFYAGENFGNSWSVEDGQLTLIYIPTAYGPLTSNFAPAPPAGDETPEQELASAKQFNAQRMANEVAAMRRQIEKMQAELDAQASLDQQ